MTIPSAPCGDVWLLVASVDTAASPGPRPAIGRAGHVSRPQPSPAAQHLLDPGFSLSLEAVSSQQPAAAQDGLPAPLLPAALLLPGHGLLGGLGGLAQRRLRVLAPPPGGPLPALRGEYSSSSSIMFCSSLHPDPDLVQASLQTSGFPHSASYSSLRRDQGYSSSSALHHDNIANNNNQVSTARQYRIFSAEYYKSYSDNR